MKFLIIRFSSLSEIILSTPLIRCIKKQLPGHEVHFLTMPKYADVFIANPDVDRIHVHSNTIEQLITELSKENFEQVIDLEDDPQSKAIIKTLGIKSTRPPYSNINLWLYRKFKISFSSYKHRAEQYFKTMSSFNIKNDGAGVDYFIPDKDHIKQEDIPVAHRIGYIGVVVGGKHFTKRIPLNKLKEFCEMIQYPVVLLGGRECAEMGNEISSADPIKIYNSCGKFSLHETADLIKQSKIMIGPETGLMHIAAAFKKPTITIWGNTSPFFGRAPYYGTAEFQHANFEIKNLSCKPCSNTGLDACPKKHFNCMQQHSPEKIISVARQFLKL